MTIQELINSNLFTLVHAGDSLESEISTPYCCDLLSIAMSRAPEKCAWITVMANINTLAVASLTDCGCIVLAEGTAFDEISIEKAVSQGITVLSTHLPVFEAALSIWKRMQ